MTQGHHSVRCMKKNDGWFLCCPHPHETPSCCLADRLLQDINAWTHSSKLVEGDRTLGGSWRRGGDHVVDPSPPFHPQEVCLHVVAPHAVHFCHISCECTLRSRRPGDMSCCWGSTNVCVCVYMYFHVQRERGVRVRVFM